MKNTNEETVKTESAFVVKCKALLEKMYVDKDAEKKFIKPLISWSILGGEAALVAIIALIVFLTI